MSRTQARRWIFVSLRLFYGLDLVQILLGWVFRKQFWVLLDEWMLIGNLETGNTGGTKRSWKRNRAVWNCCYCAGGGTWSFLLLYMTISSFNAHMCTRFIVAELFLFIMMSFYVIFKLDRYTYNCLSVAITNFNWFIFIPIKDFIKWKYEIRVNAQQVVGIKFEI